MKEGRSFIIFDFDGVIVNSEKKKFVQLKHLLKNYDVRLTKPYFSKMVGMKTEPFLRKYFGKLLSRKQINAIVSARRTALRRNPEEYGAPIDATIKIIKRLHKDKKYVLALATGTDRRIVNAFLRQEKMSRLFEVIVAGNDVKQSKPNPAVYRKALQQLHAKSRQTTAVEDSRAGIQAAHSAGIKNTIALTTNRSSETLKGASRIVSSLANIAIW
jgi:beta-phosphoglucomutase